MRLPARRLLVVLVAGLVAIGAVSCTDPEESAGNDQPQSSGEDTGGVETGPERDAADTGEADTEDADTGDPSGDPVDDGPTEVPDEKVNDTIYQAFYWEAYEGLWDDLPDKAEPLAEAGVTAMWLPPAAKPMGGVDSVGYDVYDQWDLGEFDQKGGGATRYGTRNELQEALEQLDEMGVDAYYDAVFNHRMGADGTEEVDGFDDEVWTRFELEGRDQHYTADAWGELHHDTVWDWRAFNGIEGQLFPSKSWGETFADPYLMGNDIDYTDNDWVADEMTAWGEWIVEDVGFDGFRLDAIAHVDGEFTRQWVEDVQDRTDDDVFFVAEAWVDDVAGYLEFVGVADLEVFDFPLREDFVDLSGGDKDMRWWGGLPNSEYADRAVHFVDNHDTSREGNPYGQPQVYNFKNQAYAYILMREEGTPTVFARDWDEFGMDSELEPLIEARRYFAYGPGHEGEVESEEVYGYVREGSEEVPGSGLVLLISGRDDGGTEEFEIDTRQPETEFVDHTGHVDGTVTTDGEGVGEFSVQLTEAQGWSVWVPASE